MSPKMFKCPECEGDKTVSILVSRYVAGEFIEDPPQTITCTTCNGAGVISAKAMKEFKAEAAIWCHCGNPSGESQAYADGEHPEVFKHHYRCQDCGKVTQTG